MKTIAFILLSTTAANAQSYCYDTEVLRNNIATNTTQELVLFGQVNSTNIIEIYVSEQEPKAFTVVYTHVSGQSCLRAVGTAAEVITPN
jgi:hypothetical protein